MSIEFSAREVIGDFTKSCYHKTIVLNLEYFAPLSPHPRYIWQCLETFLAIPTQGGAMPWASRR